MKVYNVDYQHYKPSSTYFVNHIIDGVGTHIFHHSQHHSSMPCGKKRKRHKIATHKRKKRLRKNRHKKKR